MNKKFKLLLLDTGIVIGLHDLKLWDQVVEACEIILPETVVEEAKFCGKSAEYQEDIDLAPAINAGRIKTISVDTNGLEAFRLQFDPTYLERLDPGETEALAYLTTHAETCLVCSADAIVFKVLGRLHRGEQGISLEAILSRIGFGRKLEEWRFTEAFRQRYTKEGQTDMLTGRGLKKKPGR
ncbi:MAG: hypothetical protein ABSE73_29045 [Planctomycetota bacterium]